MDRHAVTLTSQIFMAVGGLGLVVSLFWNVFKRERRERGL